MKSKTTETATIYVDNVAPGTIVMWSGILDSLPNGYVICDGKQRTPDLKNKFIYSSNEQSAIGQQGGNTGNKITLEPSNIPEITGGSHEHSVNITSQEHTHTYNVTTFTPSKASGTGITQINSNMASTGGGIGLWHDTNQGHTAFLNNEKTVSVVGNTATETVTIGSLSPAKVNIAPEYVALAFIMKKYPSS